MAGADTLTIAEVALIKAMLRLFPKMSKQEILSYFTRPGRDINHRLISEIANWRWLHVPPAPLPETLAYMAACASVRYPDARCFHQIDEDDVQIATPVATLELNWWPAGQGLFSSGRLNSLVGGTYSWVYDCGSSSGAAVRDMAIRHYRRHNPARRIDLAVVSHFDADHINGIEALVRRNSIGTLLLPYLPLWQRLLIAVNQGVDAADPLSAFFVNPVAYLAGIEGGEISEIVFVLPAGPDDIAPGPDDAPDPDRPIEGVKIEYGDPPDECDGAISQHSTQLQVRFLRPGGRIIIPALWEFVPYNDAQMLPRVTPAFLRRASIIARNFVEKFGRRQSGLKILKRLYDQTFGSSSSSRNIISLFLYSGPVGFNVRLGKLASTGPIKLNSAGNNFAQLLTGDGYLDTPARLAALQRFYSGGRRLDRAGILQVMHHGAKGNWHAGLAGSLQPAVSIFCSDPAHKGLGHPHADVLRDFWTWCPTQVDRTEGFNVFGQLVL